MKIAILAAAGYEDQELWYPKLRFLERGDSVTIASADGKDQLSKYGYPVSCDCSTKHLSADEFDCVIIPGGIKGAENLRMDEHTLAFVKTMHEQKKTIAAICHGPWVLISSIPLKGKRVTCYKGMKDDLIVAGAKYEDSEVVVDENIITARKPGDLPAFMKEILKR